ncbi:flagellar export chaperone FliS [Lysobacter korlensis]|uniref:Flagellar secretion chaperone FliS n=1 Tax=Lysobacter korlensis TaxID=553636 RepID=A0ABV6RMF3_9GAMM
MYSRNLASQYKQTGVTSAVLDADPHKLISLLFAGVRERLKLAAACMQSGNIARKGEAISQASLIIGNLDGTLDHQAGGEIAANLGALYEYAQRRLVEANVGNDVSILVEIDGLFGDIESAWNAISPQAAAPQKLEAVG